MIEYRLMEALAVVVQKGGFEKAAQHLYLTQPAVSQRIKQLEEQVGQILIARSNPPVATLAGQQLIKHFLQVKQLEGELFNQLNPNGEQDFVTLAIGTNRDCLTTWLLPAISPFLMKRKIVIDFRGDDQEQTHQLMKSGELVGCISVNEKPIQGCRVESLGCMDYRLVATPSFKDRWLPKGINKNGMRQAPLILFDRKDKMHKQFFGLIMKDIPQPLPLFFVPSNRAYTNCILSGLAYGLLPEQECNPFLSSGEMVDLCPDTVLHVKLYWHCWNLKSKLLEDLTEQLIYHAQNLLHQ